VHAADLGARVITVAGITCLPANRNVDQGALGAAIRYAAVDKDAVIVAAAGNSGAAGSASGAACESKPAHRLRPSGRSPQLGGCHLGLGAVLVAAVRAVGGLADSGRSAVEIHDGRPMGGRRRAWREHRVGEQSRRRRPGQWCA